MKWRGWPRQSQQFSTARNAPIPEPIATIKTAVDFLRSAIAVSEPKNLVARMLRPIRAAKPSNPTARVVNNGKVSVGLARVPNQSLPRTTALEMSVWVDAVRLFLGMNKPAP